MLYGAGPPAKRVGGERQQPMELLEEARSLARHVRHRLVRMGARDASRMYDDTVAAGSTAGKGRGPRTFNDASLGHALLPRAQRVPRGGTGLRRERFESHCRRMADREPPPTTVTPGRLGGISDDGLR